MKHLLRDCCVIGVSALLSFAATSCVDEDYDLSKDIDLTINVGGNLTVPSSSTDKYTMAQILDLDEENSSITSDGQLYGYSAGDYVLVQTGDPTNTHLSIPRQQVKDIKCNSGMNSVSFIGIGSSKVIDLELGDIVNSISIEDHEIDEEILSISKIVSNIFVNFDITPTSKENISISAFFKPGFTITFPKGWTIAISDPAEAPNYKVEGNVLKVVKNVSVNLGAKYRLPIVVKGVDFSQFPAGQGLYAPGKFRLKDKIISRGPIGVVASQLQAGKEASIQFDVLPSIPTAEILEVTGAVNPKINIKETSFQISDIPEFLKEPGNNLDITNPQLHLTIVNNSPVDIDINGRLIAVEENGERKSVQIGSKHSTTPIMIAGNSTTEICISRTGDNAAPGALNVVVPGLGDLISTIPDHLEFTDVEAKVPSNKEYTFTLGTDYRLDVDYKAIVPLAFGPELEFTYSTDETEWNEDLDKYSFNEALVTISVENTVPLDMTPNVIALDREGNEIRDITAKVEGFVKAGKQDAPTTAELKVRLTSKASNLGNLDGVRLSFKATCPGSMSGVPLNKSQALRFTDIRIKLIGGVNIDLN